MMGLLGAMSAVTPQGDRPSVLPPLSSLIDRTRPDGRGLRDKGMQDRMDESCRLAGLERGKPLPKDWRGGAKVRVIHAGDIVTMDFIESRRNVHVDKNGNVTHVTCG